MKHRMAPKCHDMCPIRTASIAPFATISTNSQPKSMSLRAEEPRADAPIPGWMHTRLATPAPQIRKPTGRGIRIFPSSVLITSRMQVVKAADTHTSRSLTA